MATREEYIQLLCDMVKCRAETIKKDAVNKSSAVLQAFLKKEGVRYVVENCDGYDVIYASTVPGKTADFIFNAHIDVVPAMTEDQYEPVIDGETIHGRGVDDCLGPVVCITKLLVDCKNTGASVGAIFNCDEERGGHTAAIMVDRGYGEGAKLISVVDGPNYAVAVSQKGIVSAIVTARGETGHSSRPWLFKNALDILIDAYIKIRDAWPKADLKGDLVNYNSMALCQLNGGFAHNQIPDKAEMVINFRVTRPGDNEKVIDFVKKTTGLEVSYVESCQPVYYDENTPMLANLKNAMAAYFPDKNVEFAHMFGATDARHFVRWGVPVAVLGVEGQGPHSQHESLSLKNMFDMADFFAKFVKGEC